MAQMCEGWGYTEQAEQAWWLVAKGGPGAGAALDALQRHYRQEQNARGLQRVAQRALQLNPDDAVAANNCASLGLLLQNDSSASRLAGKLHEQYPRNVAFAATYAFALHRDGGSTEALGIVAQFKNQALHSPVLAAYGAIICAEQGERALARQFFAVTQHARLLPEGEALLRSAAEKAENS